MIFATKGQPKRLAGPASPSVGGSGLGFDWSKIGGITAGEAPGTGTQAPLELVNPRLPGGPFIKIGPWMFPMTGGFIEMRLEDFATNETRAFFESIPYPEKISVTDWFAAFRERAQPTSRLGIGTAEPIIEVINPELAGRWGLAVFMGAGKFCAEHPGARDVSGCISRLDGNPEGGCHSCADTTPRVIVALHRFPPGTTFLDTLSSVFGEIVEFVGGLLDSIKAIACSPAKPYIADLAVYIAAPAAFPATKLGALLKAAGKTEAELKAIAANPRAELVQSVANGIIGGVCGVSPSAPVEVPYPPGAVAVRDAAGQLHILVRP